MNTPRRFDLVLGVKYCLIRLFTFYMIGILIQNVLCSCCFLAFGGFFLNVSFFIIGSPTFYIISYILFSCKSQEYFCDTANYLPMGWAKLLQGENHRNTTPFLYFDCLRHDITIYTRLAVNLQSCLNFPNSGVTDMCHYVWLHFCF